MRAFLAALSLLLAAPAAALAAAPVVSGSYNEAMLLGYDPASGHVSGYFNMTRGENPSFSCIFYIGGKLAGGRAAIDTWYPAEPNTDRIKGELVLTNAKTFTIRLAKDHGGCGMVEPFADASQPPWSFDLATAFPWIAVAAVKSAKAYFYDAPGAAQHRKGYVVQGDGVGIRAIKSGWAQVDYVDGSKASPTGWLKTSDLYPTP